MDFNGFQSISSRFHRMSEAGGCKILASSCPMPVKASSTVTAWVPERWKSNRSRLHMAKPLYIIQHSST